MEREPTANRRRIFTPEQRAEIVRRFRQSGLKQREFVAQEGISLASLNNWLYARGPKVRARNGKPKFEEVLLPGSWSIWSLEVISPKGWTVRLSQMPVQVEKLQSLLRCLPC